AMAAMLATFGRAGGRWWWQVIVLARRFRRRRELAAAQLLHAVTTDPVPDPVSWLRTLAPAFSVDPVVTAAGPVGVGTDGDGWFAMVEVSGYAAAAWVPYEELALLEDVSTVQLVLVLEPGPDHPRPVWVAVRVRPGGTLMGGVSAVQRSVGA